MTDESDNQRRHSRYNINKEFETIEAFITEYVTDISESGVFIRSRQPLPVGTKVNLRFSVLLDEVETVEGIGEVVRVVDSGEDMGMGVEFRDLPPASQRIIDAVVGRTKS